MTYRELALRLALKERGVRENPPNSNDGPRVKVYQKATGAYKQPWCASFVQWAFHKAGVKGLLGNSAYVPTLLNRAKDAKWAVFHTPMRGDLACFDWNKDGEPDHIGFVLEVLPGGVLHTLEGNTSLKNDSNGGEVMVRSRNTSQVAGFIRVPGNIPLAKKLVKPLVWRKAWKKPRG